MDRLLRPLAAIVLFGMASGCASMDARTAAVADRPEPTHKWIADMDVPRAKYNFDNNVCAAAAHDVGLDATGGRVAAAPMRRGEPAFVAYERCMEGKGYNLATY